MSRRHVTISLHPLHHQATRFLLWALARHLYIGAESAMERIRRKPPIGIAALLSIVRVPYSRYRQHIVFVLPPGCIILYKLSAFGNDRREEVLSPPKDFLVSLPTVVSPPVAKVAECYAGRLSLPTRYVSTYLGMYILPVSEREGQLTILGA
ncbi:hypothetical protein F4814DRAFT_431872 [Daldinia grandis]|nr:hypothetical protein F4814DRAFT_431872 [Daldinia grandis]